MELTDAQKAVLTAMRDGAALLVLGSNDNARLLFPEDKTERLVAFDVWRPVYGHDLIRRDVVLDGGRLYHLTEFGRTVELEPGTTDGPPDD